MLHVQLVCYMRIDERKSVVTVSHTHSSTICFRLTSNNFSSSIDNRKLYQIQPVDAACISSTSLRSIFIILLIDFAQNKRGLIAVADRSITSQSGTNGEWQMCKRQRSRKVRLRCSFPSFALLNVAHARFTVLNQSNNVFPAFFNVSCSHSLQFFFRTVWRHVVHFLRM
jgi:hypothetical protein